MKKTRREHIIDAANDLMSDFLYYDRKEDNDLPTGSIQEALEQQEITTDEILAIFRRTMPGTL